MPPCHGRRPKLDCIRTVDQPRADTLPGHVPDSPCSLLSLILGDAIGPNDHRLTAELLSEIAGAPPDHWPVCDGYHCALCHRLRTGPCRGVDPWGLFPPCYAVHDGALVVATSCELALADPCVERKLDGQGPASILVTNGQAALSVRGSGCSGCGGICASAIASGRKCIA